MEPSQILGLEGIDVQYDNMRIEGTAGLLFSGYVDLRDESRRLRLQADELRVTFGTLEFEARGNVVFDQARVRVLGDQMIGDLDAGTGVVDNAVGVAGAIRFRARKITQIEPGLFKIEKGVLTPCVQASPVWEFRASSMTLEPGSRASMTLPTFRVKGIPIFMFPYLYWPLQDSARQTGFLLPSIGSSPLKGFMFSETFFWAIGRSADVSLTYERFSRAGNGFGVEFRHALGENSRGSVEAYHLQGIELTPEQIAAGVQTVPRGSALKGQHVQSLPSGFMLRANADFVTSTEFARGYRDQFARLLQRRSTVGMTLARTVGATTLTLTTDNTRNFISDSNSVVGRRLPEIEFRIRRTQVSGPVYFSLESSAARFIRLQEDDSKGTSTGGTLGRLDAFPEVSLQINPASWINLNPFLRWRSTYYTHSLVGSDPNFSPDPIFRNYYEAGIEVVGPSIFRIFDTPRSNYSPRFKHVIEPRIVYSRLSELQRNDAASIVQFDEIDRLGRDRHFMTMSLTSRFLAQRYPFPQADTRSVWELLSLTFSRSVDLRPRPPSQIRPSLPLPYNLTGRLTPTERINISGGVSFTHAFIFGAYSISGGLNFGTARATIQWFRGVVPLPDPNDPTRYAVRESTNQLSASGDINLFGNRISLQGFASRDLLAKSFQTFGGSASWNIQCCSIGARIRTFNFSFRTDTQVSVLLELAQVGQFGFGSQRQ